MVRPFSLRIRVAPEVRRRLLAATLLAATAAAGTAIGNAVGGSAEQEAWRQAMIACYDAGEVGRVSTARAMLRCVRAVRWGGTPEQAVYR